MNNQGEPHDDSYNHDPFPDQGKNGVPDGFENLPKWRQEEILNKQNISAQPKTTRPYIPIRESELSPENPEWKKTDEWREFVELRNEINQTGLKLFKLEELAEKNRGVSISNELDDEIRELEEKLADLKIEYENQKDFIKSKIRRSLEAEIDNLNRPATAEEFEEYNRKLNDQLFETFIKEEIDSQRKFAAESDKNLGDKVKEGFKKVLENRLFQRYMGLNKWVRLGVNTTLFTIGGYALGTAVAGGTILGAAGWGAQRLARGAASIGMGGLARGAAEKYWSEEKIDEEFKKREKEIKEDIGIPDDTKQNLFNELRNWEEKEKRRIKRNKTLVTIGVGAGAGLLAGLTEGVALHKGPSFESETMNNEMDVLNQNRILPRTGFKPLDNVLNKFEPKTEELDTSNSIPKIPKPPTEEQIARINTKIEAANPPTLKALFENPEEVDLVHEVKAGDSTWKILKETLENNEEFDQMSEAQKTYVLSALVKKVLEDPEGYGLGEGGTLNIGEETDFTALFGDTEEVKSVFAEAKEVVKEGSPQEKSILVNNKKIANWVNNPANKSEILTNEKVADILATKVEVDVVPENPDLLNVSENVKTILEIPETEPYLPETSEVSETPATPETPKAPEAPKEIVPKTSDEFVKKYDELMEQKKVLRQRALELQGKDANAPESLKLQKETDDLEKQIMDLMDQMKKPRSAPLEMPLMAGGLGMTAVAAASVLEREKRAQIQEQIRAAEARIAELTPKQNVGNSQKDASPKVVSINSRNQNLTRSPQIDAKNFNERMMSANKPNERAMGAFMVGVDGIFGSTGFLGFSKLRGVDSKEWKEIDSHFAKEIVQYTKGELEREKLPVKLLSVLDSAKGQKFINEMINLQKFIKEMINLAEQTKATVIPGENERPGQYMIRLIEFVMKKQEKQENFEKNLEFKKAA